MKPLLTPEQVRARVDASPLFRRGRYETPRVSGALVPPGLDWAPTARIRMKRWLLTGTVSRKRLSRPVGSEGQADERGGPE